MKEGPIVAMTRRILVPVDFSNPSLRALDYAVEFGRTLQAELLLLHVVEPIDYSLVGDPYGVGFDASIVYQELERVGREQLSRLAARLRARRVAVRTLLGVGPAHRVIVDTAKKQRADVVIMSTHGRTGLPHLVMGSVAERVVRNAACPVLTVRGHTGGVRARPQRRAPRRPARARRSPHRS